MVPGRRRSAEWLHGHPWRRWLLQKKVPAAFSGCRSHHVRMNRPIAALLMLALCGAALLAFACWWSAVDEGPPPLPRAGHATMPLAAAGGGSGAALPPVARAEASVAPGFSLPALPPVPADAHTVDVLVVDHATDEPMADVEVTWRDERCGALLAALTDAQRQQVEEQGALRWRGRTDARGLVAVHLVDETMVWARSGPRAGELSCLRDSIPPAGFVLRMYAQHLLQVLVRDAYGRPAPAVEVHLTREAPQHTHVPNLHASTDAEGRVEFAPRWQEHEARSHAGTQEPELRWVVRAHSVGRSAPHRQFEPQAAERQLVELQLPPCGRVSSQMQVAGLLVPGEFTLKALGSGWSRDRPSLLARSSASSAAVFPWVELGVELELWVNGVGQAERVPPLLAAGEERHVTVVLAEARPLVRFRLVDALHRPLASTTFNYRLSSIDRTATTDANGWFQDVCESTVLHVPSSTLHVRVGPSGPGQLHAIRPGLSLRMGMNQLGEVVVTELPVLVGGQFVTGGKPASAACWPTVQRWQEGAGETADWVPFVGQSVQVEGNRFLVRAPLAAGRYRLIFEDWDFLPRPPIEFVPGDVDLVIEVAKANKLVASLRGDLGDAKGLVVALSPQDVATTPPADRRRPWLGPPLGGSTPVEWSGLPTGTYAIEVRLPHIAERILRIDDVVVPQPFPPDPRLAIDLRGVIETLQLQVAVAGGEREHVVDDDLLLLMPAGAAPVPAFRFFADEVRLLVPARPIDVLVAYAGCEPLRVPAARGAMKLTVMPYPLVEVRLADSGWVPAGFGLQLQLEGGGESVRYKFDGDDETGHLRIGDPSLLPVPFEAGLAKLFVGPRPQRLLVLLVRVSDDQVVPLQRCGPRALSAMAYDRARQEMILFGDVRACS